MTLLLVNDAGGGACVAPFGSAAPFLSTNPLACGIPREPGRPPLVIDLSTSVVALGKIRMAANRGDAVPEGWLIDREGRPATQPAGFFATAPQKPPCCRSAARRTATRASCSA